MRHLPWWTKGYVGAYLVVWTVTVGAALTNAAGLGLATLTGGAVPPSWGAVLHSLAGCACVWFGGYARFEKLMKVLVGVMGFSLLYCAGAVLTSPGDVLKGLLVPSVPDGGGAYAVSLIGGIGGSITMLSYSYWMREEGIRGPGQLSYVRSDIALAYVSTALFVLAFTVIADRVLVADGVSIPGARAVPFVARALGGVLGPFGEAAYALGFWAAVFASLLGVWQSMPYLYADLYGAANGWSDAERRLLTTGRSRPYRGALLFIALAPLPFAVVEPPLALVVTYTVIGSLFVPFLAATLLFLNNRIAWVTHAPRNRWPANVVLAGIIVLFVLVGALDVRALFG